MRMLLTILTLSIAVCSAQDLQITETVNSLNQANLKKIATCELASNPEQKLTFYASKSISDLNDGENLDLIVITDLYRKTFSSNMNVSISVYSAQFRNLANFTSFYFNDVYDFSGTLNWAEGAESEIVASPFNKQFKYKCTSATLFLN